jgi:large subunit ribosomal protein L21
MLDTVMNYAVVKTGGKQYRVTPGDVIDVEKLPNDEGTKVELTEVLLVSQDGKLTVGSPLVPDAKVLGDVQEQGRGEKLVVFKFKAKTRQRTKTGHRQSLTRLLVQDILVGETSLAPPAELPEPPKRRRTRPAAKAPAVEKQAAPPKRRRIRSAKSARELLEEKEDGS